MKILTVRLPDDLHTEVRLVSAASGESLQHMMVRLLRAEARRQRKTLRRVYGRVVRGGEAR